MISGIDLTEVSDFICKNDKDNPTIWKIGVLPSAVMGALTREVTKPEADPVENMVKLARVGLRGWVNFKVKDKDVEFRTTDFTIAGQTMKLVDADIVNIIPLNIITEIATAVLEANKISVSEQKN